MTLMSIFTSVRTLNPIWLPDFPVANIVALNVPMPQLCQWWGPCHEELRRGDRPHCHTERRPRRSLWFGSHSQLWAWLTESRGPLSHHSERILCCGLQVLNHGSVLQWRACELNLLPCPCVIQLFCRGYAPWWWGENELPWPTLTNSFTGIQMPRLAAGEMPRCVEQWTLRGVLPVLFQEKADYWCS
jgi:hypothetical protein